MLATLTLLAALAGAPRDTAHIVLVATTDVHGRATAWDYVTGRPFGGGLVRAGTIVDSLRRAYPGQVIVMDAGDLLQGDPFAAYYAKVAPRDPNPVIEAMNLVGYDVATLGNHDFNWGVPFLGRAVAGAAFPYVSGNVYALPADTLIYPPYVVLQRSGVRVGIAGFTTPGVMLWDRENVKGRVRVGPVGASAGRVLAGLARDADLRIVLIHSGMDERSSYDTTGVGAENVAASLAGYPARPDLVLVGHSHKEMRDSVIGGVHFIQPKNWAQEVAVAHVDLVRENGRWRVTGIRSELVPLATVPPSPRIAARLAASEQAAKEWVAQPLGQATADMPARLGRAEATPLVNFINDVQRRRTGAQLSTTPVFSVTSGFRAGPITLGDVAGVYPYENTLRAIRISGAALKAFLEHSARYYRTDSLGHVAINDSVAGYNFDIVSGATYDIDLRLPVGSRIRNLAVGGRPVAPSDSFTFALNSYRQAGGGGYDMVNGAPVIYDRSENVRDVLVDEIRKLGTLDPATYTRTEWRIVPDAAAAEALALAQGRPAARPPRAAAAPGDSIVLRVLAINDFHGALLPRVLPWSRGRLVGGAAALKARMDSAAAGCGGCPVLRLDAGDEMQGTLESNLFRGRSVIEAFNRMGIQAAAIGNHDFDWSVDTLRQRMAESRYPWLASNIFDSTTGRRPVWAVPYRILNAGPLRVAVIGWITPETKTIVKAENIRGLTFARGVDAIRDVLDSVRAARPDVTVLVAHSGAVCDSTACQGEILDLARELGPAVDLIVAGHTHRLVNTAVGGVEVVEARSSGSALGILDVIRTPVGSRIERARVVDVFDDEVTPDTGIARLTAAYAERTDSLARGVVARIKLPLLKSAELDGQYPLGNLIADAERNGARADFALMNNGGIRGTGLPAGPVTYAQLFELSPFQNNLVRVTVTGAQLRSVMEHALQSGTPRAHISGFTVRYDPSRPAGRRVVEMRTVDGHRIQDQRRYTLATLDFLQGGGDGFSMLTPLPVVRGLGVDLDTIITYLQRLPQPVEAPAAPRIVPVGRR
jgi:2',3'-cyclic-nucleotide 2'-phosphodiesterase/3'-nucleotidase/5'-nucleotidase